jgi:hypothetical protein
MPYHNAGDSSDPASAVGNVGVGSNAASSPKPSFAGSSDKPLGDATAADTIAAKLPRRHPVSGRFIQTPPDTNAAGQVKKDPSSAQDLAAGIFGVVRPQQTGTTTIYAK